MSPFLLLSVCTSCGLNISQLHLLCNSNFIYITKTPCKHWVGIKQSENIYIHILTFIYQFFTPTLFEPCHEKSRFLPRRKQGADQLAVTGKLISTFVFATQIVQSLFFLNPKFQASSLLLLLHSQICVGPGRKPRTGFLVLWLIYIFHAIYSHKDLTIYPFLTYCSQLHT